MSDPREPYDPNDPAMTRRTGPATTQRPLDPDMRAEAAGRTPWGWIAGGLLVLLLIFAFMFSGGSDRTAQTPATSPTTTTGQAPSSPPARTPAENTGENRPATPPAATPPAATPAPTTPAPAPQQ